MKALLVLLLLTGAAMADLVVEQQLESTLGSGAMSYRIKGDLGRIDLPPTPAGKVSMLVNASTGELTSIMHGQKAIIRLNVSDLRAQTEAAQKSAGLDAAVKPVATGKKEKIGAWSAEEYVVNASGVALHFWVAPEFPNWQVFKEQLARFSKATVGSTPDPHSLDLPGMVVKTVVDTPAGKVVTTLTSIKEAKLTAKEFQVPDGYQIMPVPSGLGGK